MITCNLKIHMWNSWSTYRRAVPPPPKKKKMPYLKNVIHPPTHLVCNAHLIANFLSIHVILVVAVNCGAENTLHSFEISMFYFFNFISYTYPNINCHCGHKMLQNNANLTFPESRNDKDYENIKLVNLSSCKAAQLTLILSMIFKNSDFGLGGNVKFFTEANFILINKKIVHRETPLWLPDCHVSGA